MQCVGKSCEVVKLQIGQAGNCTPVVMGVAKWKAIGVATRYFNDKTVEEEQVVRQLVGK